MKKIPLSPLVEDSTIMGMPEIFPWPSYSFFNFS